MRDFFRALGYFRHDGPRLAGAGFFLLLSTALSLFKPWPLALIVDSVLGHKPLPQFLNRFAMLPPPALLAGLSAALLLLYVTQAAAAAGQNFLSIQAGLNGLNRLRVELFNWLQRLSWRFYQSTNTGDLIYRSSWDTYSIQTLFQQGAVTGVGAVVSIVVMLIVMVRMNVRLTLLSCALAPLLLMTIRSFGIFMRERTTTAQQADSRLTTLLQQALAALPLTQSYTRETWQADRYGAVSTQARAARGRQHGSELVYWFAVAVIFALGAAAVVWLGGLEVMKGHLTVGELLVFLAYLTQLFEPLNQLSQAGSTVAQASAGTRRVFAILDATAEATDPAKGKNIVLTKAPQLCFDRVSFSYDAKQMVLNGASFALRGGEAVAVVGGSGAGKTTLLNLIPRFLESGGGEIRLDDFRLQDFSLASLRSQIAYVAQEPFILPGSVAENIGFGRLGASMDEIMAAAKAANAITFIEKLPQQFQTQIGEGATNLSAGERQRLHLARAFLKNAPVLLLDEPTSALDGESEELIAQSIRQLMQGRTTVLVAHRPATIAIMPRVLRLQNGVLIE